MRRPSSSRRPPGRPLATSRRSAARPRGRAVAHGLERLHLLRRITSMPFDAVRDVFPEALRLLVDFFGLDAGAVSSVQGGRHRVLAYHARDGSDRTGLELPLSETYCALSVAEGGVVALPHVAASEHAAMEAYALHGYETYIGVPVLVGGQTEGTLCLVGLAPRPQGFSDADAETVRLLAHWAGERLRNERDMDRLRQSEVRFRVLASSTFEAILLSAGGVVFEANESACALFGYRSTEDFRGLDLPRITHPDHLERVRHMVMGQHERRYEARLLRADGSDFLAEIQGRPIPYEGRIVRMTAIRDVSEARAREQHLRFHADVLAQVHDAVIATDRFGRIVFWNDGARRLTGLPEAQAVGQRLSDALRYEWMAEDGPRSAQTALRHTGQWHGEVFVHTRYGPRCAELTTTRRSTDSRFDGLIVVARDVTDRYASQQELLRQARQDALTGQLNRAAFVQRLAERHHAYRLGGPPYGIVFIDLNGFKEVNDTHGHAAGDALLVEVGARLRRLVRQDDAVARLGGDEFAVLLDLPDGPAGAEALRRRIGQALALPLPFGQTTLHPSASLGVTVVTPDHPDADAVLREADAAMYDAKRKRGGSALRTVAVPPSPSRAVLPEGDMVLYAQPIVGLDEGALCGFEVLVRWQHPTRGLLGPGAFLPTLLASDAMPAFDARVIARAAAWTGTLPAPLRMHVNLSRRALLSEEMPARLARTLDATGLDPARLIIELTEQLHESDDDLRAVERLAETGVGLCLDDFGAGHTSVALTEALPLSVLKVDRRLVGRLGAHSPVERMLEGLIGMAHARGIVVVAEGIETPEHLLRARMLGFDQAQGFLLSYPLPLDAAADLTAEALPWASLWAEASHPLS